MPKNKQLESSDDDSSSDSGPDDRAPPKKVAKKESPPAKSSSKSSSSSKEKPKDSSEEEGKFALDKNRFVTVREFRGKVLIDIREFYTTADGETRPGKKGISLNATQWNKLKSLMGEIDDAVQAM